MHEESNQTSPQPNRNGFVILLLFILVAVGFYYRDHILNFINDENGLPVAFVTDFSNDVKQKKVKSLDFKKAKQNAAIRIGDSIFTGNRSTALVTFKTGDVLTIDQNSLVTFDEMSGVPEFVEGNVKLHINGPMKIKLNDEIVELKGTGSTVQVYTEKKTNKTKLILLDGLASVAADKKEIKLEKNLVTSIKESSSYKPRVTAAEAVALPPQKMNYRFYEVYTRAQPRGLNLKLKPDYIKPGHVFEKFEQSQMSVQPVTQPNSDGNRFNFKISDEMIGIGYVVEISPYQDFHSDSQYFWSGAQFEHNFERPGNYYLRYRKVLFDQVLSENSPEQEIKVSEKIMPLVIEEPTAILQPIKKIKPRRVVEEKVVIVERKPAVTTEAVRETPVVVPEKIKDNSSQTKLELPIFSRNQNYSSSHIGLLGAQAFLASGQQIKNGNTYSQIYNLGIDIRHWKDQHGIKAAVDRAVLTENSSNQAMSIELGYLYRFTRSWGAADGGRFQYYLTGAIENYTNSNATADYLSSYDLYKFGLGASMPIFNFWQIEAEAYYGLGSKIDSALLFSGRTSYFLTNDMSIGLGFRARKVNYKLLNTDTNESLSETFTTFQKHY